MCSNVNPLYYCVFWVPRKAIDGIECGLFSIHALLGQTILHVYSVLEEVEVRITVCVTVCVV